MKKLQLIYSKAHSYITTNRQSEELLVSVEGTLIPAYAIPHIATDRFQANEYLSQLLQQLHLPQSITQSGEIYIPYWKRRRGVAV